VTHEPGRANPLADDLVRLLAPNPSPFTGEGTWVHLIGRERLVVLDPGPTDPAHILADGERVTLAGQLIEAVHTPGHTSNHLCFAAGARLFSGDHVMGWSTTVVIPPDGHMGAYMASLDKLRSRPETIYHPAHGEPVEDPQRLVRGLLTHRVQRERQLLRLLGERPGTVEDLVARAYPGLDPRLVPAAGATATAHLITLEERGAVTRVGETWAKV